MRRAYALAALFALLALPLTARSQGTDLPAVFVPPPILMYHRVDTQIPRDRTGRELTVTPAAFGEQLAFLKAHRIAAISMAEMEERLRLGLPLANTVVLTFDDGYSDQYAYALPLLRQYGDRATFYIVTGTLGRRGHLTWPDLQAMLAAKMDIGAHGVQHYDLSQMTAGQQAYQIDDSITTLQHRLHTQIRSYAYPSGRFNRETLALVRQADVPIGVTTDAAFVLPPENPYEITRLRISGDWSIGDFERALRAVQQNRRSVEAGNGFPPPASSAALQGTIAAIHGTRVLISRGKTAITIDDSQAIKNGMAQNLYVGRAITAYGYWSDGTFFATSIA